MFLLSSAKVALYVPESRFEIKDYFKLKLQYTTLHNDTDVSDCKYLIEKKITENGFLLNIFLVHDIEEIEENIFKLFLQKYIEIDEPLQVEIFTNIYSVKFLKRQCLLNLAFLNKQHGIFAANFQSFITALPVMNILSDEMLCKSQQEISQLISKKFKESFISQNVEFKNGFSIIINFRQLTDDKNNFIIKKGIKFSVEFGDSEKIWINLISTNFSRTIKPVTRLSISEPIDHNLHRFVNITTGNSLPYWVKYVSEIKFSENFYETFSASDALEATALDLRFSQEKFWFEQTSLSETVQMIAELRQVSKSQQEIADFDGISPNFFSYKIIHRKKKFVFANEALHHTAVKGLYNSGVLRMPEKLKIKIIISTIALNSQTINKVLDNFNKRIEFLYKNTVSPILEVDLIDFDYMNFSEQQFFSKVQEQHSYIVHLIKNDSLPMANKNEQRQKIDHVNKIINKVMKKYRVKFTCINDFDMYIVANALLKIGVKHKAIPWKIDFIDVEDRQHIFIGVDLGHDHLKRISNLTLTVIDNHGCLIDSYQIRELPLNEVIPFIELQKAFYYLCGRTKIKGNKVTVHRDGIFKELDSFHAILKEFGVINYNLVEVIKDNVPSVGFRSVYEGHVLHLDGFEGYYVYTSELSYLITNDQSLDTNTSPVPLKIRKKSGYKSITELTEEVYWLTKPYSINIFKPSKLPVTTLFANNLSYSRDLVHFTTK